MNRKMKNLVEKNKYINSEQESEIVVKIADVTRQAYPSLAEGKTMSKEEHEAFCEDMTVVTEGIKAIFGLKDISKLSKSKFKDVLHYIEDPIGYVEACEVIEHSFTKEELETEEWRAAKQKYITEDKYEVSHLGRVREKEGDVLLQYKLPNRHLAVLVELDNTICPVPVYSLVLNTFKG